MWGHTWQDLAHADTAMRQPWATLRALGLYKSPSAEWGVDYISSASMRLANGDNGYREDELEDWVRLGGFKFLPAFLEGNAENGSWHEYLLTTLARCEAFMKDVSFYSFAGYILIYFSVSMVFGGPAGGARRFGWALFRVAVIYCSVFALYQAALKQVRSTQWAKDISHNLRYTSPFGSEEVLYEGPTTMPHRNDVLIETRYKSEYLAIYNDYVGNHPGNRLWDELVNERAPTYASYSGLPSVFRQAVAEYIVSAVRHSQGRFLAQNPYSDWVEMRSEDAITHTNVELAIRSNSIRKKVVKQLDFLVSEVKYGPLRHSAMNKLNLLPYMKVLRSRLVDDKPLPKQPVMAYRKGEENQSLKRRHNVFRRTFLIAKPGTNWSSVRRLVTPHVGQLAGEPETNAWLRSGDIVNALWEEEDGVTFWYKAKLLHVSSSNYCQIRFFVDNYSPRTWLSKLTRYIPPSLGDVVGVKVEGENDDYDEGTILRVKGGGFYDVDVDGEVRKDLHENSFRQSFY
jgi:hypothetical protein